MLSNEELGGLVKKFVFEEVSLNQEDISSAVASKEWLLRRIQAKIEENLANPTLYTPSPFIGYGSYFVRVKVTELNEMDFLVVIDSNTGQFSSGGSVVGKGLGSSGPNHKYGQRFMKSDGSGVSPQKLLKWLRDTVADVLIPLGGDAPVIDGPAVKAELKSKGIKFDLVPCGVFKKTDGSGDIFYNIPNAKLDDGWTLANPDLDRKRVEDLAEDRDEFRNVIRILKFVRDHYELPISSYAIQCAVCDHAERNLWYSNVYSNLRSAVHWLHNLVDGGHIPDGFDPGVNLLKEVQGLHALGIQLFRIESKLAAIANESDLAAAYEILRRVLKNSEVKSPPISGLAYDSDAVMRSDRSAAGVAVRRNIS
jgi:hypothetical protein